MGGLLTATLPIDFVFWGLVLSTLILLGIHSRQAKLPESKPLPLIQNIKMLEVAESVMKVASCLKIVMGVFAGFALGLIMRLEKENKGKPQPRGPDLAAGKIDFGFGDADEAPVRAGHSARPS